MWYGEYFLLKRKAENEETKPKKIIMTRLSADGVDFGESCAAVNGDLAPRMKR